MHDWLTSTAFIDGFFPSDRSRPCYGFYCPAVDRIVLVDAKDLFLMLEAAVLFSSKVLLLVAVLESPNPPLDNDTCHLWAPHRGISQSAYHVPQLLGPAALIYAGPSSYMSEDALRKIQQGLRFVLHAACALHVTERIHNINDARDYATLFPEFDYQPSELHRSFLAIRTVLYDFDTIDQAMKRIDEIILPQRYYERFNNLLYGRPVPPFK